MTEKERNELIKKLRHDYEYGQAVMAFSFIKSYNQVKVENILKKLKIDKANFYNFKCKKSDYLKVEKYLLSEIAKLFVIEEESKND